MNPITPVPFSPSPRPQARHPLFYVLPPAGYFCHQRQKYPKTPLETTFQDFLGALCSVINFPYIPRVIAFPVCRCPSKGLCHHSFPLPLRCRCLLPREELSPLPSYRGERDEGNGFPRRFAPRNDNVRGLYNEIPAAQRAAPTPAAASAAAGARFDNRPPHRERVSKGRGRARPFPLDASRGWDF